MASKSFFIGVSIISSLRINAGIRESALIGKTVMYQIERYISIVLPYIDPNRNTKATSEVVVEGVIFWELCP
jgi:hypothetical protein